MDRMRSSDRDDEQVAEEYGGIIPAYRDTSRRWQHISPETRNAVLPAMGLEPDRPRPLIGPDIRVLAPGETMAVERSGDLILEDGTRLRVEKQIPPDSPLGYHHFRPDNAEQPVWIIQRPSSCWMTPALQVWDGRSNCTRRDHVPVGAWAIWETCDGWRVGRDNLARES